MNRCQVLSEVREARSRLKGVVGFVPTMGALHRGHRTLLEQARSECDSVAASIFVNPTQFGPREDLSSYPRTLTEDLKMCRECGVDLVWTPAVEDIHLPGSQTEVEVTDLGSKFEGRARPGHFRGVSTVVAKLFGAISPDRAYFGQKDLQQLFLIRQMVRDLLMPVKVVAVSTARNEQGLALSSRNAHLTSDQRDRASGIYRGLQGVVDLHKSGERDPSRLRKAFQKGLAQMTGAVVERFDLLDRELNRTYEEGESVESGYCSVAVRYAGVRLIDNMKLCS